MDQDLLYRAFEANDDNAEIEAHFALDSPLDSDRNGEDGALLEEFPALDSVEAALRGATPPSAMVLQDAALEAELAIEGEPLLEALEQQTDSATPYGKALFPDNILDLDDVELEEAFGGQAGLDELVTLLRQHRGLRITISHDSGCDCG